MEREQEVVIDVSVLIKWFSQEEELVSEIVNQS